MQEQSPLDGDLSVIDFDAAVAVFLALAMVALYQVVSVSTTELATASKPQSVHLQDEAGSAKAK
jgi:hypothetical protein